MFQIVSTGKALRWVYQINAFPPVFEKRLSWNWIGLKQHIWVQFLALPEISCVSQEQSDSISASFQLENGDYLSFLTLPVLAG